MIRTTTIADTSLSMWRRYLSAESEKAGRRFIQTIPITSTKSNDFYNSFNYQMNSIKTNSLKDTTNSLQGSRWAQHKVDDEELKPFRRSRTSRFKSRTDKEDTSLSPTDAKFKTAFSKSPEPIQPKVSNIEAATASSVTEPVKPSASSVASETANTTATKPKKRRVLKPRKALITLTTSAIEHLRKLVQVDSKFIRIGVQNRGCSGLTYNLEYVTEPGKFDELVEQDGVKVFIDSKALFSIVGSEMDWLDDKLSSRFIFKNPNSKGTCGCGESFMV